MPMNHFTSKGSHCEREMPGAAQNQTKRLQAHEGGCFSKVPGFTTGTQDQRRGSCHSRATRGVPIGVTEEAERRRKQFQRIRGVIWRSPWRAGFGSLYRFVPKGHFFERQLDFLEKTTEMEQALQNSENRIYRRETEYRKGRKMPTEILHHPSHGGPRGAFLSYACRFNITQGCPRLDLFPGRRERENQSTGTLLG